MLIDPWELRNNPDRLEEIEKASLRLVAQGLFDYRKESVAVFREETDWVADIGEDITREALDKIGMSKIDQRLFGKIDYKRARYLFHPDFAVKQALFVDSKAENISGRNTATLQTSQFSMHVRQFRAGKEIAVPGKLPPVLDLKAEKFISTTIFVKYNYDEIDGKNELMSMTIAALPNGFLQDRYNPSASDGIWLAGRNAPTRGEEFRVRLSFSRLKEKSRWRVQNIDAGESQFTWDQ